MILYFIFTDPYNVFFEDVTDDQFFAFVERLHPKYRGDIIEWEDDSGKVYHPKTYKEGTSSNINYLTKLLNMYSNTDTSKIHTQLNNLNRVAVKVNYFYV